MTKRLDDELVARGLSQSRSRARDAVLRGTVTVNGRAARKPSQTVQPTDELALADLARHYVSRAALKLVHALDYYDVVVEGCSALDVGASTGGFTQVLLERGAKDVVAIDVGHGQMVPVLSGDPRVTLIEGVNARNVTRNDVPDSINMIVCDVSFISLKLVLPPVLALVKREARLIALVKPQFEVGRAHIGKGGIVSDPAQHERVCTEIHALVSGLNWSVKGITPSPLVGGDGNQEFLLYARRKQ